MLRLKFKIPHTQINLASLLYPALHFDSENRLESSRSEFNLSMPQRSMGT